MNNHVNITVIDGTKHSECELCGNKTELRPYGPNGENVCFDCGMKDEKSAIAQFAKIINGNNIVVIK